MKKNSTQNLTKTVLFIFLISISFKMAAQQSPQTDQKSAFWQDVQFGGGFGLGVGNGYTDITIAPSAIYNFNDYFALGAGLQYSFIKQRDLYSSHLYGGNIIGLVNPVEQIQLSVELEQLRVNLSDENSNVKNNFWNTGLYVGIGYRMDNVTIGARYNLLFDRDKSVYSDAFMPFIRVYF